MALGPVQLLVVGYGKDAISQAVRSRSSTA